MPLSPEELDAIETPEPTQLQSWLGRRSFLGRLGETLGRPTDLALTAIKSAPKLYSGQAKSAGEDILRSVKGLPGVVTGAIDVASERVGAPSLQDYVDEKLGYDPDERTTGQDVLKEYGLTKRANQPLFSPAGAAGFAIEALGDPLHIGAVAKGVGTPLRKLGAAAERVLPKGLARTGVEEASAAAERVANVIKKEGLTEEALRRKRMDLLQSGGDTSLVDRELDALAQKYGAPGVSRESQLVKTEQRMGQNVGTGSLQITPENERFFQEMTHNPEQMNKFLTGINDALQTAGKKPLDLITDGHPNRLKHAIDQAGLRPEKVNDIIEAATGVRPIAEDAVTQARMRMFQHAHAQMLNSFGGELLNKKLAYVQKIAPEGIHPTGKPGVNAFYVDAATRRYTVDGLTYNGAPLVFPNVDEANRAAQVFQYMRPDTVGKITPAEKLLDIYDDINRLYRYGVTQPFPQYAIINKITNRMNANVAGDIPVIGKHYDVANAIMGGKGYDEVFDIAGQKMTGKQLVDLYQRFGPDLPNINPALGFVPELDHAKSGVLGTAMRGMQAVGKPLERASAGFVGTLTSPTGLGPAAMQGKVGNRMLEEGDRFGVFIHSLMNGMDPQSAVRKADIVLGNQSAAAMTPLEREWGNRGMLFYNYMRNTIPIMAKAFTEKPGTFNAVLKADRQRKEQEPGYLREGISVDLPGEGSILSNLPNPIENVTRQFGAANPASMTAPLIRGAYEYLSGDSTLTGRPLSPKAPYYMPESLTTAGKTTLPGLTQLGVRPETQNQILGNLPISRALSVLNYAKKPETTWSDLGLNLSTGMKVQRFDPKSTNLYNEAEAYEQTLRDYMSKGAVMETPYGLQLVPEALPSLSPQELQEVSKAYGMYSKLRKAASKVRKAGRK